MTPSVLVLGINRRARAPSAEIDHCLRGNPMRSHVASAIRKQQDRLVLSTTSEII